IFTMKTILQYINGEFRKPNSNEYIKSINPSTGELIGKVATGNASDVQLAVKSAKSAYPKWKNLRPIVRGRILNKIAQFIRKQKNHLADIEARESGKSYSDSLTQVEIAAQYFEFYGGLVNVFYGENINLGSGYHSFTRREPYGVVGAITPWNAPINQAARAVAPALAVGNTIVIKPSEETSETTVELAKMACEECELPPGVFNVVLGTGKSVGEPLVSHNLIRKLMFTGSVRAGREISHIAADRLIPLTLELGGKSPNIVFEDADLNSAVQ